MQFCPARHDFTYAFARKLELARQRFFTVFRELRQHRRKKLRRRRRLRFYSLGGAWVRIEFRRRQRHLFVLVVLREQTCTRKNDIAPKGEKICTGIIFNGLATDGNNADPD